MFLLNTMPTLDSKTGNALLNLGHKIIIIDSYTHKSPNKHQKPPQKKKKITHTLNYESKVKVHI